MKGRFKNNLGGKRIISRKDMKGYELIGDGKDGEVYRLTNDKCIKVFFKEETQSRELRALQTGQSSPVIPRLYSYGANYIIMECINGISLSHLLKKERKITEELTKKILFMLAELKRIGFTRLDSEVRHILINKDGDLKVIDHKRAFTSNSSVPTKLLKGFKKYRLENEFLSHVKNIQPSIFHAWKEHI